MSKWMEKTKDQLILVLKSSRERQDEAANIHSWCLVLFKGTCFQTFLDPSSVTWLKLKLPAE